MQYVTNIPSIQTRTLPTSAKVAQVSPVTSSNCDSSQINLNGICYPTVAFCQGYNPVNVKYFSVQGERSNYYESF